MADSLFDNHAFPVVTDEREVLPALRENFVRAVTLRHPDFQSFTTAFAAKRNLITAPDYHRDVIDPKRRYAGRNLYAAAITTSDLLLEADDAGITINPLHAGDIAARCETLRSLFTATLQNYSRGESGQTTGRLLFTPMGGLGRAARIHVDNTVLTLHWSAALAPLGIVNGEPDADLWQALDKRYKETATFQEETRLRKILDHADVDTLLDLRDNRIGDVVIGKGQQNRDMSDPAVRASAFVHKSSDRIVKSGQAAFILTPASV